MPEFKSVEDFQLALLFIVPGVVALFIRSKFITGRAPSAKENVVAFVVISLVYYSVTFFLIERAFTTQQALAWILLLLVGPAVFGFILGVAAQKEWGAWAANRLGLSIVHVIPAAWDWRFSKITRPGMFVMATLTSGEKVGGFFGSDSFASSDIGERDLYIEEEYVITDEGTWQSRPEKVGVLISAREIRYIEFWNPPTKEGADD
jgi:hypothetical protein